MSNLLPKNEQKRLKTEYSLRRITVLLSLVSFALLISLVLLFPSYLLSRTREKEVNASLENAKQAAEKTNSGEDVKVKIRDAKNKVGALDISNKNLSAYELFRIFENKTDGIKLSGLSYSRSDDGSASIKVDGKADTREGLTQFSRTLQARPEFSSVDLPISNFAKDSNIDFTMNISVKKQ